MKALNPRKQTSSGNQRGKIQQNQKLSNNIINKSVSSKKQQHYHQLKVSQSPLNKIGKRNNSRKKFEGVNEKANQKKHRSIEEEEKVPNEHPVKRRSIGLGYYQTNYFS